MTESIVIFVLAVLAIGLAWKVLKGVAKTAALAGILVIAALVVFGRMA